MKRKKQNDDFAPERTSNALSADVYLKRKQYKRKRKTTAAAVIIASVLAAAIITLLIVSFMKIGVIPELTVEAGEAAPEPSASGPLFFQSICPTPPFRVNTDSRSETDFLFSM